jgi:hypothetical protein
MQDFYSEGFSGILFTSRENRSSLWRMVSNCNARGLILPVVCLSIAEHVSQGSVPGSALI